MKKFYISILTLFLLQSCEDCKIIEDMPTPNSCEGVFYSSRFIPETPANLRSFYFDTFNQPLSNPYNSSQIEQQVINDPNEFFSMNFSAYDQINNRYAFFYLWDDSPQANTLYLADTNPTNTTALIVQRDYAAPVFLNGKLYAIDAQTGGSALSFEILEIDQSTGQGNQVHFNGATIDGIFANGFVSSATNNIDTIYFLAVKTLIAYNVVSGTSKVLDVNIQYDADIKTALSGLEYRTATNQLIVLHHKANSPNDKNEVISINTETGSYTSLFDLNNNIGDGNNVLDLLINSTTYSSCADTYYVTELTTSPNEPIENSILAIDLKTLTLTKQVTPNFIFGIALDETP